MSIESQPLSTSDSVSVLFAHPYSLLREGIAEVLRGGGFQVVGQTDSIDGLRQLLDSQEADVVLLDWEVSGGNPELIETLAASIEEKGQGVVTILTGPQTPEIFMAGFRAGVNGYLSINLTAEEFLASLRMLAKGDLVVSKESALDLKEELVLKETGETKEDLSDREQEVLSLVSRGATNREIADSLSISENTVKAHLRRILDKLDVRNRQQAAAFAVQEGWVEDVMEEIESSDTPA